MPIQRGQTHEEGHKAHEAWYQEAFKLRSTGSGLGHTATSISASLTVRMLPKCDLDPWTMTSQDRTVLVFGPTGAVGCAAAIEAHGRGAHVWLVMRDPRKSIEGLSDSEMASKKYTPIQADLSKPDTVKQAVQQSGARSAFVYTIFDSPDNMRSTFDALKEAGIEHVVLLSSYSVKGPAEDENNMRDFIQRIHANTEV